MVTQAEEKESDHNGSFSPFWLVMEEPRNSLSREGAKGNKEKRREAMEAAENSESIGFKADQGLRESSDEIDEAEKPERAFPVWPTAPVDCSNEREERP